MQKQAVWYIHLTDWQMTEPDHGGQVYNVIQCLWFPCRKQCQVVTKPPKFWLSHSILQVWFAISCQTPGPKTANLTELNIFRSTHPSEHQNCFMALYLGLHRLASTRRNMHPFTPIISSTIFYQLPPSTTIHSIILVHFTCLMVFS